MVRQRSATPLSPVQIRVAPLERPGFTEVAVGLGLVLLRKKEFLCLSALSEKVGQEPADSPKNGGFSLFF